MRRFCIFAVALLGFSLMVPARGATVLLTYSVSGTFTDGGAFSGTFGYDPVANAYVDSSNPILSFGQFYIATGGGSQGLSIAYAPGPSGAYYSDANSTPKDLYIYGSFGSAGPGAYISDLTLDWNTALNAPGGGNVQAITGGEEAFSQIVAGNCFPYAYCVVSQYRVVATGHVALESAPVPLPAAAWLMLSGLGGLGVFARRRQTHV